MKKKCPICPTEFERSKGPGNPNQTFCSRKCQLEQCNRDKRAKRGSSYEGGSAMGKTSEKSEKLDLSPAGWAAWVFKNHELDGSQKQLVMMGLEVLTTARDGTEDLKLRLSSMGRFQAIISQLNLPKLEEDVEEAEAPAPVVRVPRPSVDPRKQLRVVS